MGFLLTVDWFVLLTLGVSLAAGFISGLSGGGGGFIMIPYFILIGLSPQQALATAKMGGIGVSAGALTAFRGSGLVDRRYLLPFVTITAVSALISAWLIPKVDSGVFQVVIGILLIAMSPTMFIKKSAFQPGARSPRWIAVGFVIFVAITFLQTMFGSGLGTLIALDLMFLFGMSALQAQATRRVSQAVQAIILFVLLLVQGLVLIWQ